MILKRGVTSNHAGKVDVTYGLEGGYRSFQSLSASAARASKS